MEDATGLLEVLVATELPARGEREGEGAKGKLKTLPRVETLAAMGAGIEQLVATEELAAISARLTRWRKRCACWSMRTGCCDGERCS